MDMAPSRNIVSNRGTHLSPLFRLWQTSNAPDYAGFIILFAAWTVVGIYLTPFHRMFYINDLRIAYPYAEQERVTVFMNFVYGLFVPLGILIAYNIARLSSVRKHEATYLPLAISITLGCFITDTIKNAVGRPRPDFLARCHPDQSAKPDVLLSIEICTAPDGHKLQDGWRSFPSGHSTFAFAGLGFVSLFLAGQLHVFNYPVGGRDLTRALICLLPLLGAAMVAISRCEDYRHDVYDVCIGSLIGMTSAYWSYRRHWPKLSSVSCDEPYPPRGTVEQPIWEQVRDEEAGLESSHELFSMNGRGGENARGTGRTL